MQFLQNKSLSPTQLKVLNSALQLFVEKGFFNTSISDLVHHSGVSSGSIYHGFKDKQHIAETLMSSLLEQIEQDQRHLLSQYDNAWEQYEAVCAWLVDTAEQHPHAMQFVLNARHKEFMPDAPPICSSTPFLTLRDIIQQGVKEGVLAEHDVMMASAIAYGGLLRLIQLSLDGLLDTPLREHLQKMTTLSWNSIKKQS